MIVFVVVLFFLISCGGKIAYNESMNPVQSFRPFYGVDYTDEEIKYTFNNYDLIILQEPSSKMYDWDFSVGKSRFYVYRDAIFAGTWDTEFSSLKDDWFLRDPNGNKIMNTSFNTYFLDISNPEYRAFLVEVINRYIFLLPFVEGVFLDDYWSTIYTSILSSSPPKEFSDNFVLYMKSFIEYLKENIYDGKRIITNDQLYWDYTILSDGGMDEGFIHSSWMDNYADFDYVRDKIYSVKRLSSLGKTILLISSIKSTATSTEELSVHLYTLAAYLLVSGPKVYYFYRGRNENYNSFYEIPSFYSNISIGYPASDFVEREDGLFYREFSNGLVLFNPTSSNLFFELKDFYIDVYSQSEHFGSITIPSHTGIILRKSE